MSNGFPQDSVLKGLTGLTPKKIVTFFTVSNDSIRLTNKFAEEYKDLFLEDTDLRDKSIKRFPGVLLGRLAPTNSSTVKDMVQP